MLFRAQVMTDDIPRSANARRESASPRSISVEGKDVLYMIYTLKQACLPSYPVKKGKCNRNRVEPEVLPI